MNLFIVYFGIALLIGYGITQKSSLIQKGSNLLFWLCGVLSVLCFRIGVDTGSYIWLYHSIVYGVVDNRNIGYTSLIRLLHNFGANFYVSLFCVNVFVFVFLYWTIQKHSRNQLFSYLLFFGSGLMMMYYNSGIRQMIAMAIYVFAFYQFLPKKNWFAYYVCCGVAILFHESAVLALLVPLLFLVNRYLLPHPKRLAAVIASFIILVFLIIQVVLPIVYDYYFWIPRVARLAGYFMNRNISILGLGMETTWFGVILGLYYLVGKEKQDDFDRFQIIVWGFTFILYLSLVFYPIMSRFCDFLQAILIIFVPNMVMKIEDTKKRQLGYGMVIALNAILLFGDVHFTVEQIRKSPAELSTEHMNIPYVTLFQTKTIEQAYHYYFD